MTQIEKLRLLLPEVENESDALLELYLEMAKDIICEIRNTTFVESKYLNVQIKMAVELLSKRGAEGQTSHSENGLNRVYEVSEISSGLLNQVTPVIRTPYSTVRETE